MIIFTGFRIYPKTFVLFHRSHPPEGGWNQRQAGAFGFYLHRRFEERGIKNDVLDAAALHQSLDRDERGNKKAFSTVRIPTVDKERERQRFAGMGRRRQRYLVCTTTADTGRARSPLSSLSASSDAKH